MSIHEPVTLLTDCLLAALAAWFAWRLPQHSPSSNRPIRWWSLALGLTALSALVGGLYHGLAPNFPAAAPTWWTLTLLLLAFVSAVMGLTLVHELAAKPRWQLLVAVKLLCTAGAILTVPRFLVAIIDYGVIMLAWAATALITRRAWSGWMLAAVALSALGAWVQQRHWSLSPRFNHNDLYHVVQGFAIFAFYRAGRRFGPPETGPASAPRRG